MSSILGQIAFNFLRTFFVLIQLSSSIYLLQGVYKYTYINIYIVLLYIREEQAERTIERKSN